MVVKERGGGGRSIPDTAVQARPSAHRPTSTELAHSVAGAVSAPRWRSD